MIPGDKKKQVIADKDKLSIKQISKKHNLTPDEVKDIINASSAKSFQKKTPGWFYAILILIPIIFIVVLEIFLRIINYGYDFTQWVDAGGGKLIINPDIGRKYFSSGNFVPNTIEDVFDQQKKEKSFRIFVLGGSSAQGYPYNPMGSFSRYIRKRLELVYPNTTIEVVNLGMTAVNSYTVLDLLPGVLEQRPDLIIIYAGHNEYYGALGVGSVQSYGSSRTLVKLILYLDNFKTTQLIRNSIQWVSSLFITGENKSSGTLMSRMANDKQILLNSEKFNAGLQQFENNLSDILQLAKDQGVPVILGKLVSNLKDQEPFVSVSAPGYKTAEEMYKEAEAQLTRNSFRIADSLFRSAKELDAIRFRAPQKINNIIDELGIAYNCSIVAVDSVFSSVSPGGIVGNNLMVDHLHPNVQGYQLMGKAFYERMEDQGFLPKSEPAKIPFNEQDSITREKFVFTKLDSLLGNNFIKLLKSDWPYVKRGRPISEYQEKDFINLFQPADFIDSLAMFRIQNKMSWADAHFIAATYYLRKDDIKEYLKYMDVLIYQYPGLKDLDGAIRFYYEQKKLDLADYTPKRNGLLAINIGNYDNAVRHLTKAYNLDPHDPLVLYTLSFAYLQKKEYTSALRIVNECLVIEPNYREAEGLKKEILSKLKN